MYNPIFNNLFNAYFGLQYTNDDPTYDTSDCYEPDYEVCPYCGNKVETLSCHKGETMCTACVEAEIKEYANITSPQPSPLGEGVKSLTFQR